MTFTLITVFLVGVILLMGIYTILQFLGKFPARTIDDVRPYLRPTELEELEEILDPANEANFKFRLSPVEFRQLQRKRIHLMREYLLRMSHNALILIEWGNLEWMGPAQRADLDNDRRMMAQELVQAATEFRMYSLLALLKLKIWILFRLDAWPVIPSPKVSGLRRIAGIDAVKAYLRLREAVSYLSEIHGHQYQEELVARL
ncbi:MAG TPA: hypothetical protein VHA33_24020 [Candidatus Angelobacter sp.]|jgi:hypothetical protein|nr:hypothetical protein [Candidatus Angelobacter sp.]